MIRYEVTGGRTLNGELHIQGSKNAVLPMMAAAVLNEGRTVLHNCPRIEDVFCMIRILEALGCSADWEGHTLSIDASFLGSDAVPREEAGRMRSSVILLGALLGRGGRAVFCAPGGCVIGERPIDLHLSALEKLGAEFEQQGACMCAAAGALKGTDIVFPMKSVGATENVVLAAVRAEGVTTIHNAAREPEIAELCRLLAAMGADIAGAGSDCIRIRGVRSLHDAEVTVMSDRIVAGTYLLAAAATGGELTVTNPPKGQLAALLDVMCRMGFEAGEGNGVLTVRGSSAYRALPLVDTSPYPGFPTDLQSQLLAVLTRAEGTSRIRENIFESRFRAAGELQKLGADVQCEGSMCTVTGTRRLRGAALRAHELRGGAALLTAGLLAEGTTAVLDGGFIRRGYERIEEDLYALGADIAAREMTDDR